MKRIFRSILLCIGVFLISDTSALKHSDDVKNAVKFVDVFLGSAEEFLQKESKEELRKLFGELRPYIRRLQTYGYILNPADIVDLLDVYERVKRNFLQVENRLKPNTAEECRRIFGRLDPVIALMREVRDRRVRNAYPFIRPCDGSKPHVDWMLKTYSNSFVTEDPSLKGSGNLLGYLSTLGEEPIVVELRSGFFAQSRILERYRLKSKELLASPIRCFILNPVDIILLAGQRQWQILPRSGSIHTLTWSPRETAVIEKLEKNEPFNGGDIEVIRGVLLPSLARYIDILLTQLEKEGDPAAKFKMPSKENNPRLVADRVIKKALLYIVGTKLPRLLETNAREVLNLLRALFWNPEGEWIDGVSSLLRDKENSVELCRMALKLANLAFHTEAQVIVLISCNLPFKPVEPPLISLFNPCTSCFRLPYIFTNSPMRFFHFGLCDEFYRPHPRNILQWNGIKASNPEYRLALAAFAEENDKLSLRQWLGVDQTAIDAIKHYGWSCLSLPGAKKLKEFMGAPMAKIAIRERPNQVAEKVAVVSVNEDDMVRSYESGHYNSALAALNAAQTISCVKKAELEEWKIEYGKKMKDGWEYDVAGADSFSKWTEFIFTRLSNKKKGS
jgi:hypothetical protein